VQLKRSTARAAAAEGTDGGAPAAAPRQVACPTCRRPALFAPDNPWRPFCSERCRAHDLGAWASEDYRVPAAPPPEDDPAAEPPPAPR
jgi:uncharacterized protein